MRVTSKATLSNTLEARLAELAKKAAIRVEAGIHAAADTLLEESRSLVPTDTHALKESGGVRVVDTGFQAQVIVGYGPLGFTITEFSPAENRVVTRHPFDYAVYVHEVPAAHVTGQANYLDEPRQTKLPEMRAALHTKL